MKLTREALIERDLKRNVWTVMGLPFDVTTEAETAQHLIDAAVEDEPCFFTTPNLNFAITAMRDNTFYQSVINSDWVVADGMPLVWVARQFGVPLPERVAGSSVFERIHKGYKDPSRPLRLVFFGGPDGVASEAFRKIETDSSHLQVVGFYSPGFGSMDEMSATEVIEEINSKHADIILVALGAKRGQEWIERNREALNAPVISHLGAVINFVAGTVSRAPLWIQKSGLEWLWRIWEENSLFKRYWHDGKAFLKYYFNNIRPYKRLIAKQNKRPTQTIDTKFDQSTGTLSIIGDVRFNQLDELRQQLIELVTEQRIKTIDFSGVEIFDASFTGLLQLLNKHVRAYVIEGLQLQNLSTEHQDVLRYLALNEKL